MTTNDLVTVLGAIVAAINTGFLLYFAWKKLKPEVKKIDIEADSEIVDAANLNLEGAKISASMLLDRINELKGELATETKKRRDGIEQVEQNRRVEIAALEKKRSDDARYFRRRIKDLEKDARDYRLWAAKLVKQVVEAGKVPVPFTPSFGESEQGVTSIRVDLESDPDEEQL